MIRNASTCERACYTIAELRQLLGIGRTAVYQLLREKTIPNIRVGRKFIVPKAAVAKMLESVACDSSAGALSGTVEPLRGVPPGARMGA